MPNKTPRFRSEARSKVDLNDNRECHPEVLSDILRSKRSLYPGGKGILESLLSFRPRNVKSHSHHHLPNIFAGIARGFASPEVFRCDMKTIAAMELEETMRTP